MNTYRKNFSTYSRYYDLLYRDKDYVAETAYIQSLLTRHGVTHGDLLEFGSGTGKHGCLLAAKGYTVLGIDRSAEMVAQAESMRGFTCQQGDICKIKLDRCFDAVMALFHVISYQTNNEQLIAVFNNAASHLREGGLFLFDFWFTPAVYSQLPAVRVKRVEDEQMEVTRIAEPAIYPSENRVDVHYTIYVRDRKCSEIQVLSETHPMRHFSLPEIDLLAQMTGFKRIDAEEFLTEAQPGLNTWGVCVTLKKVTR